ncbi:MAG: hypothetical protein WC375_11125, partial [Methanomassiliicoccales archaeon]
MTMLRYKPYLADVAKIAGANNSCVKKLDKKTLYEMVVEFGSPDLLTPMFKKYAGELGYPHATEQDIRRMAGDGSTILIFEALSLFYGVLINVEDPNFVRALLRTKIDAITGDVRLPFPIMEFSFPNGIDMGDGLEVSSALVLDMEHFDIRKEFGKYNIVVDQANSSGERPKAHIAVLSRMRSISGDDVDVCIHRFCKSDILGDYGEYLPAKHSLFIKKEATLIMSLLLYLQCFENNQALQHMDFCPRMAPGIPAVMAKLGKRHESYYIRDLLNMGSFCEQDKSNHGGSHASPTPHRRTWALRSLRHEKYKRNADGSIRVILVKPCIVGVKDGEDHVRGERTLKSCDIPPTITSTEKVT